MKIIKVNEEVLKKILNDIEISLPCRMCHYKTECDSRRDKNNNLHCSDILYNYLTKRSYFK